MKNRLLSLMLVSALCLGSTIPILAYDSARADMPTVISSIGSVNNYDPTSNNNTAFIDQNGALWVVGSNYEGQLGIGNRDNSDKPVKVMENVTSFSLGKEHIAAIKTDHSLWMWGDNTHGQLGNGRVGEITEESGGGMTYDFVYQTVPVKIMDDVAAVSCGHSHTAVIKTDGSLWMWGLSDDGELGNGGDGNRTHRWPFKYQTVPIKVMDDVAAVSCGSDFTAIVTSDGSLWTCGKNYSGNLGIGTSGVQNKDDNYQKTPVKIMDGVASVYCFTDCAAAIKTDGSLWMWGHNHYSQLGNNFGGSYKTPVYDIGKNKVTEEDYIKDNIYQTTPVKVLDDVTAVSVGSCDHSSENEGYFTFAIRTDGSLWVWGEVEYLNKKPEGTIQHPERSLNHFFGHETATTAVQPTPAKLMDDVAAVFGCYVVKKDGSLLSLADGFEWTKNFSVKIPGGSTQSTTSTTPGTPYSGAVLSPQKLVVDGKDIACEKYNIGGSNYFKLRDIAYALNGTGSQFGVGYDEATFTVAINTGEDYTPTGTEMKTGVDNSSTAKPSSQSILVNGVRNDELTVYNIGGSNFFQLRELGDILGFEVGYNQDTNTAIVRSK